MNLNQNQETSVWIEPAVVCSLSKTYLFTELFIISSAAQDGIFSTLSSYLSPQEKPPWKGQCGGGWGLEENDWRMITVSQSPQHGSIAEGSLFALSLIL